MALKRIARVYLILGKTFNAWFSPLISGVMVLVLRMIVGIGRIFDHVIFWGIRKPLKDPIIIVGNPRSGTTFLHRFLIKENHRCALYNLERLVLYFTCPRPPKILVDQIFLSLYTYDVLNIG